MGKVKICLTGCAGSGGKWELGVCRCCELVDGDTKQRLVKFCSVCKVNLCRQCFRFIPSSIAKRIKAFGLDILEGFTES